MASVTRHRVGLPQHADSGRNRGSAFRTLPRDAFHREEVPPAAPREHEAHRQGAQRPRSVRWNQTHRRREYEARGLGAQGSPQTPRARARAKEHPCFGRVETEEGQLSHHLHGIRPGSRDEIFGQDCARARKSGSGIAERDAQMYGGPSHIPTPSLRPPASWSDGARLRRI